MLATCGYKIVYIVVYICDPSFKIYIEEFAKVIIILPLTLPSSSLAGYPPKQWLQQQKPHGSALGEMVGSKKWTCQEIHPVFSGTVGRNH